jgi:hypothetical protein
LLHSVSHTCSSFSAPYIYMHFFSSIFFVALGFPYVQQLLRPLYIYMHFFLQNLICSDPNLTATASPSNNLI